MKQCEELLESDSEIYLHCLGNAIKRGITLALKLVEKADSGLAYEANTSTIDLIGKLSSCKQELTFIIFSIRLIILQMIYIL